MFIPMALHQPTEAPAFARTTSTRKISLRSHFGRAQISCLCQFADSVPLKSAMSSGLWTIADFSITYAKLP
jgi:hypothetical protein